MIKEVTDFIEQNIEYIDRNDFISLYMAATTKWRFPDNHYTGIVTEYLLEAGINPLEYMDWIPLCMFWESNIKKVDIPETITFIENDAFNGSDIEELIIPASCDHVGPNAFSYSKIKKLTILNPYCEFDEETLRDKYNESSTNIRHIVYNGTIHQFKERYKDINLPRSFTLQANDNTIIVENGDLTCL